MQNSYQKEITKRLALKYDISMGDMKKLLYFPFKHATLIMKEGKDEKYIFNGLGKFFVKPNRREQVKKRIIRYKMRKNKLTN